MFFVFVLFLCAAGFALFCFTAGFMLFRVLCVRSVYTKNSYVDKTAHVKDEKVITPLLEAKNRRNEENRERVSILSSIRRRFYFFPVAPIKLCADLRLQPHIICRPFLPSEQDAPPPSEPADFAVLVHGFSDSASGLSYLEESYYERGFSVLSIDLRAHGESGGTYTGLGYLKTDAADIALWLRYLRQRFGARTRIILHGVSMGASASVQCAYGILAVKDDFEAERRSLKTLVVDCGFFRFSDQVRHQLGLFLSSGLVQNALFNCVAGAASCVNRLVNGFFFFEDAPGTILSRCPQPQQFKLLLFHGANDTLVPPDAARQLYEAAREPKKLVIVEHAPHIGSWFYDTDGYMREIIEAFCSCAQE